MSAPTVTVEQGQLKGKTGTDINGGTFYSFQGIPYGKTPVGELRFKAPVPADPWTGVRDATVEGSESLGKHMLFLHPVGSEDCLSLNVYTPQLPQGEGSTPKAVMVWIHGGGFTSGSSKTEIYGPEFLVNEDVVLVTINYRLGILGFLSLEDTSLGVPGNAGLKDMVLALKWVQKNISQFGGNPDNVTIFGESAGGAAVHFLMLSPLAKGLFHRGIMQSGCSLNPWAFGQKNALDVAKVLGHETKNEKDALAFLRTLPAQKFLEAQNIIVDTLTVDEQRPFSPVIEKPHEGAFLTESPMEIMLSGNYNKVPIIIGYTNKEGLLMEFYVKIYLGQKCVYRLADFEKAIPKIFNIPKGTERSRNIAKNIEELYYGDSKGPEDDVESYFKMTSDTFFIHGIQNTIKCLLKTLNAPIYFYNFSVETSLNVFKKFCEINVPGVCHGDDLGYLFKTVMTPELQPQSPERISVHRMTKLWTNFAKTGNPNPITKDPLIDVVWPKITGDALDCLDIGEKLSVIKSPDRDSVQFWDNVEKSSN